MAQNDIIKLCEELTDSLSSASDRFRAAGAADSPDCSNLVGDDVELCKELAGNLKGVTEAPSAN